MVTEKTEVRRRKAEGGKPHRCCHFAWLRASAFCLLTSAFSPLLAADNPDTESLAQEPEYYRIVTMPLPPNVQFESGGLQFVGPDKLACSTRIGDIWIGEGVLSDPPKPKWTLFASGLHEVLTMAWKDGWLYALQRGELTRLRDTNGDGRADVFETVCDDWGINGDYHEYAWGSKFDRDGNMWVLFCLTGSVDSKSPWRGWCVRITPEGRMIPTASGIRSPGGIAFNAAGDVFYNDNQGYWNGTCKLQQLKPGIFAGNPTGWNWFDDPATRDAIAATGMKKPQAPRDGSRVYEEAKRIPELLPPSVLFPYEKMGQSACGLACDLSGGKFGPFDGQFFVSDQTHSTVMRVFLEKIDDRYQGACFPFRAGFDSGNVGTEFAPDGSLFVFGTDRGWGARGGKPFALQRLVWTGKTPFEIREMHAKPDGFEFKFTQPVDPASAGNPASYTIETYTYIYRFEYGSPEVDHTTPKIKSITVAPDKMSARLVVDGLVEGHIHEMHLDGVRSDSGKPLLHSAAFYTLNQIPAK